MRHCLLLFLDFEMVELAKDIDAFGKACEHLIASMIRVDRSLKRNHCIAWLQGGDLWVNLS